MLLHNKRNGFCKLITERLIKSFKWDRCDDLTPKLISAKFNVVKFACCSGVIDEVNRNRRMYYKHQFMLLTIEFYYRFVIPSPFSVVVQILALIKKDFRRNPFGTNCTRLTLPYCLSQLAVNVIEILYILTHVASAESPEKRLQRCFFP